MSKLRTILNEEFKKFINETFVFENESLKFKDLIKSPTFYNFSSFSNDYEVDMGENQLFINWHIGFQINEAGIERFVIIIDGVSGEYSFQYYDKRTGELAQENKKNITEIKWNFEIENGNLENNTALYVQSADFDFGSKTCRIIF